MDTNVLKSTLQYCTTMYSFSVYAKESIVYLQRRFQQVYSLVLLMTETNRKSITMTILVLLSISPFMSIKICFTYLCALILY